MTVVRDKKSNLWLYEPQTPKIQSPQNPKKNQSSRVKKLNTMLNVKTNSISTHLRLIAFNGHKKFHFLFNTPLFAQKETHTKSH